MSKIQLFSQISLSLQQHVLVIFTGLMMKKRMVLVPVIVTALVLKEKMEDNDLGGDVNDNNDDDDGEENGAEDGGWVEKGARSGESCSCAEALTCNVIAPPCAMQGFAM